MMDVTSRQLFECLMHLLRAHAIREGRTRNSMKVAGVDGCRSGWVPFNVDLSSLATSNSWTSLRHGEKAQRPCDPRGGVSGVWEMLGMECQIRYSHGSDPTTYGAAFFARPGTVEESDRYNHAGGEYHHESQDHRKRSESAGVGFRAERSAKSNSRAKTPRTS